MALITVIGLGVLSAVCCLGMVGAMVFPSLRVSPRSRQSEAKYNLKSAFSAERAYFAEKDEYSEEIEKIAFRPERANRYLYVFKAGGEVLVPGDPPGGAHGILAADAARYQDVRPADYLAAIPPALMAEAGVHGKCPDDCYVTVIAVGNADKDSDLDVWSISTQNRTFGGESVPAGQPFNHLDDLR